MSNLRLSMVIILLVLMSVGACAMGSKRPSIERKDQDKLWRACEDFEVQDGSPIGKMCNRTCLQRKDTKCQLWKQNVKNFCEPVDFKFYRNGSFIMIDEDNL